ncbi:IS3 family transposase [Streptomyces sp. NPDC055109]
MCSWAGVSTSGYYHWRSRPLSATAKRRAELRAVILQVFSDSHETYGYRRVHAALQRMNVQAGAELVHALRRELGLVACQPRPWRTTTSADDAASATPDLLARDVTADVPGAHWSAISLTFTPGPDSSVSRRHRLPHQSRRRLGDGRPPEDLTHFGCTRHGGPQHRPR